MLISILYYGLVGMYIVRLRVGALPDGSDGACSNPPNRTTVGISAGWGVRKLKTGSVRSSFLALTTH